MSTFQIILLCAFGACIGAGVIAFALYRGGSGQQTPAITIWGTADQTLMDSFINKAVGTKANIYYVQKKAATFATDLISAVATGKGPDAILGTQAELFSNRALLTTIPYTSYAESTFQSTYITEAQLFLQPQGILAIPLGVDPLVMYWNKVILSNAGIVGAPTTWSQLTALVPKLTVADKAYNVTQSTVGMGDYVNVLNAKAIISLLMMQAGNFIVAPDSSTGDFTPIIGLNNTYTNEAANALTFYTQFANPTSPVYTWNRALPNSQDLFVANQLALYFGFASEYQTLAERNPNLDFDVAIVPQLDKNATAGAVTPNLTFGNIYGLAVLRSSTNGATAVSDIYSLTTQAAAASWTSLSGLAPVRLDSMAADPASPTAPIFNQSALWARGWNDPNAVATDKIFQTMVDSITSGQQDPAGAVATAQSQFGTVVQ